MKKLLIVFVVLMITVSSGFTKEKWSDKFSKSLSVSYEPLEKNDILKDAIDQAMNEDAPPCEVMRIAIGMDFKPYFVILFIYENNKDNNLDEICWCATSDGIEDFIVAKAAIDSKVFRNNEIAKSECLKKGLAYTSLPNSPDSITPPQHPPPNPRSPIK